jgi:hypothetical protein
MPKYVICGPGTIGNVGVGGRVAVAVIVAVAVRVDVGVRERVGVAVVVGVRVTVAVAVRVRVAVTVEVPVGVRVGGSVAVGVHVLVGVGVEVPVRVGVRLRVDVALRSGVALTLGVEVRLGVVVMLAVTVRVGGRLGVAVNVLNGVSVAVGDRVMVGVALAVGVPVNSGVAVGLSVGAGMVVVGVATIGQVPSELLTAPTMQAMSTSEQSERAGHVPIDALPSAMLIALINSSTVTSPSPLQSPRHAGACAAAALTSPCRPTPIRMRSAMGGHSHRCANERWRRSCSIIRTSVSVHSPRRLLRRRRQSATIAVERMRIEPGDLPVVMVQLALSLPFARDERVPPAHTSAGICCASQDRVRRATHRGRSRRCSSARSQ